MSLIGHRVTSWHVQLVDNSGALIGLLNEVSGGTLSFSSASTIKTSGTVIVQGGTVDWTKVRLQPVLVINSEEYPLGIFIPSAPSQTVTSAGSNGAVELLDRLTVLAEDVTDAWMSLPVGTVVTTAITEIIASTGENPGAITPSTAATRTVMTWEPATPKLRIINDLLDAAGFFSLWCDTDGQYQVTPYASPQDRPIAWVFGTSTREVHSPTYTSEQDLYAIPNRVVAVSSAAGEAEELVAVATNENPESPYSYQSRGRWITHPEQNVETTGQSALLAYAQRRLQELSSATATRVIKHGYLPLRLNDAVIFDGKRHVVTSMSIPLDPTKLVETTLREVVDT
ncbi:hypothetical protein [Timonella sp. A28]|uniref:hypothetical protein n=1 Tax=Timonella sp. A28 TaxID=3442640 RepID=UPI003EC13E89